VDHLLSKFIFDLAMTEDIRINNGYILEDTPEQGADVLKKENT